MIKIICVGKIKEKFYSDALLEYKKRISKYTKLEIIELNDLDFDIKKTLKEEYNSIMKVLKKEDYNILLDIDGTEYDSLSFARKMNDIAIQNSNISFIIGGSYGVSEELRQVVNLRLSFSKMTFPHQLFRVILLEQIYRAFKINNHEEYHK